MKALLIILLVLSVIALIPVGVDGGYNKKGLRLFIRIGPFSLRLIPAGRLVASFTKPDKPKKPKPIKEKSAEKKKPEKPKLSKDELFALIKMGLNALSRFRRKLTIDYLRIHITIAASDPFSAAMGYGAANAALSAIVPLAERAFNITEKDFSTSCDFLAEKTDIDFWLTASIQIWEILYVATAFGIDFLKHKRSEKKNSAPATAGDWATERTDTNGKTSYRRPDRNDPEQDKGNGGRKHHSRRPHNDA